ncbi:MAG: TetR/AcrR family transcriptional regulator [Bacillota bacterium]|nr:TetR/AcrR family transcriptional regulator [Bacillota bacterium]
MPDEYILNKIAAQLKATDKATVKQQKILDTAIRMFAEKGYSNTSTAEIAKEAGVSEVTIFRNYKTKENLLMSVILPFVTDLTPVLTEEFIGELKKACNSFEEFIRMMIYNRYNFIKSNKDIFQVVIKEIVYHEDLFKELLPEISRNALEFFNKTINTFKARGEIIDIPNGTMIRMMISLVIGYFTTRFVILKDSQLIDETSEIEYLIGFIINGLKKR